MTILGGITISSRYLRGKVELPENARLLDLIASIAIYIALDSLVVSRAVCVCVRHELGWRTASIDIDYSRKHMDFLGVNGFLLLDPFVCLCLSACLSAQPLLQVDPLHHPQPGDPWFVAVGP